MTRKLRERCACCQSLMCLSVRHTLVCRWLRYSIDGFEHNSHFALFREKQHEASLSLSRQPTSCARSRQTEVCRTSYVVRRFVTSPARTVLISPLPTSTRNAPSRSSP